VKAFDWIGRVLLLVLSGFATLSLIGAIAQVADTAADRALSPPPVETVEREAVPLPDAVPLPPQADDPVATESATIAAAPPRPDAAIARWLQALVYAVMALAGFVAAGVIVLLRITAILSRIAER
jgi:hypothetical protein